MNCLWHGKWAKANRKSKNDLVAGGPIWSLAHSLQHIHSIENNLNWFINNFKVIFGNAVVVVDTFRRWWVTLYVRHTLYDDWTLKNRWCLKNRWLFLFGIMYNVYATYGALLHSYTCNIGCDKMWIEGNMERWTIISYSEMAFEGENIVKVKVDLWKHRTVFECVNADVKNEYFQSLSAVSGSAWAGAAKYIDRLSASLDACSVIHDLPPICWIDTIIEI